jgi:hypothetical protein
MGGNNAQAPASSFAFGGVSSAPSSSGSTPVSASTGFSFSGSAFASSSSSTAPGPAGPTPQHQATLSVPPFDTTFKYLGMWTKIRHWCASLEEAPFAGQELCNFVISHAKDDLLQVKMSHWVPSNDNLRQQLKQKPVIDLEQANGPVKVATLNPDTLNQVFLLSRDLRISEAHAMCLYAQVAQDFEAIQDLLSRDADGRVMDDNVMNQVQTAPQYNATTQLATRFYFYERNLQLQTVLLLLQYRLKNDSDVLRATDSLLQEGKLIDNLIGLIQEYTQRISNLQHDVSVGVTNPNNSPKSMIHVHTIFSQQQRQMAAEALLFIAYHTQFEMAEVVSLVDVIHAMSQEAKKPSPLKDVPSTIDCVSSAPSLSQATSQHFSWPQKDIFEWQKELVDLLCGSGQIELMECLSLLIVAAVAAMDARQLLYNRDLHAPNSFGVGSMLLPPGQPSANDVRELYQRFKHDARFSWERQDMWGILACSFALLLHSAPSVVASPAKGGLSGHFSKEIREAARTGMDLPMDVHSFTFCRLTLIPYLQKLSGESLFSICNVSEFGLAVVAEFFAAFMNELGETGALPISRKRWQNDEEEELKLRREEQESQRRFEHWAGNTSRTSEEKIPDSVDLMNRPDCLDDLIALATAICSIGWDYAKSFWATDEGTTRIIPSQTLQECMASAAEDDSLAPSVLSWLAALSVNEKTANVVFRMLQAESGGPESSFCVKYRWAALLNNLRWYAAKLGSDESSITVSKTVLSHSRTDTSYYYDLSGSTYFEADRQRTGASSVALGEVPKKKTKRLSEEHLLSVTSHLAVIMNTSFHCTKARRAILSLSLQVKNGGIVVGEDETLVVLFKLALAPISSSTRGATLSTIASLLHPASDNDDAETKSFFEKQGRNAWDYLESCSLLPIPMLDRYFIATQGVVNGVGPSFPTSSLELASSNRDTKALLPNDPLYGILFEMEHVEAKTGWYPATEGVLELLKALVCAVGCPQDLGRNWRPRTGCAPYLEYVINFVLLRALGLNGKPVLPFRLLGDQCRLVAKALAVVNAIIVRYDVPACALGNTPVASPLAVLDLEAAKEKDIMPSSIMNAKDAERDFVNATASVATDSHHFASVDGNTGSITSSNMTTNATVPLAKSPGFTILVELLSPSCGDLLRVICSVLTSFHGSKGSSVIRTQSTGVALTYALFGTTPPTFASAVAKESSNRGISVKEDSLLKPLFPIFYLSNVDESFFDDSIFWREKCIQSALNVLCTAAAKEDAFTAALGAVRSPPLKLTPVLQFEHVVSRKSHFGAFDTRTIDVHASRITNLLHSITDSRHIRSAIVEYIGFSASTDANDAGISGRALSLVYRMIQAVARNHPEAFWGDQEAAQAFVRAVSSRLVFSAKRLHCPNEIEILDVILNWILTDLRRGTISKNGVAHLLLGLPGASYLSLSPQNGRYSRYCGSVRNCFDAVVDILLHDHPLLHSRNGARVASLCYEILFRLYDMLRQRDSFSMNIFRYASTKLRDVSFWEKCAQRLVASETVFMDGEYGTEVMHSMSWLLKGLSSELRILAGGGNEEASSSFESTYLECQPSACSSLLSRLFSVEGTNIKALIGNLPLEAAYPVGNAPPREALVHAKFNLRGPLDIVENYEVVDAKKALSWMAEKDITGDEDAVESWIQDWNIAVARRCATAHLSDSISLIICSSVYCANALMGYASSLSNVFDRHRLSLQSGGAQDLLETILRKLDIDTFSTHNHSMDSLLISAATKNLSKGVLELAEYLSSLMEQGLISSSIVIQLASMVAQVLHYSSIGEDGVDEAINRYQRSNFLGSALVRLLHSSTSLEMALVLQHETEFIKAAQALSRISCFPLIHGQFLGSFSAWARSSLSSLILSINDKEASAAADSFVRSCLSSSFLARLFELLQSLDGDVCELLCTIAMQPFGSELLIAEGIIKSLKFAASKYTTEDSLIAGQEDLGSNHTEIRAPKFLRGHLKLMCCLMSNAPDDGQVDLAFDCLEILAMYRVVLKRMCQSFPTDIEDLLWGLRCLDQTCSLVQQLQGSLADDSQFRRQFIEAGFLGPISKLLLEQLLENPLPYDMLPHGYPRDLMPALRTKSDNMVRVELQSRPPWWETIPKRNAEYHFDAPVRKDFATHSTPREEWTEYKFNHGIAAADICILGLDLHKRMDVSIDTKTLARGIHRTICAAGLVGSREAQLSSLDPSTLMDIEDRGNREVESVLVRSLSDALARSTEQALTLALSLSPGKENGAHELFVVAVSDSSSALQHISEHRRDFITMLCQEFVRGSTI